MHNEVGTCAEIFVRKSARCGNRDFKPGKREGRRQRIYRLHLQRMETVPQQENWEWVNLNGKISAQVPTSFMHTLLCFKKTIAITKDRK